MSESVDILLSRLDGVKRRGEGRWMARCPAHDDRRPSLSIRECGDGTVLLHDFAGCDVASVVAAVGLKLADLFPERAPDHRQRERYRVCAEDILACVAFEALLCAIEAARLAQGVALSEQERERLILAAARLQHAAEVARA